MYVDPLNPPDSSFSYILPGELTGLQFPNPFDPPISLLLCSFLIQSAQQIKSRETEKGDSDSAIRPILGE